MDGAADATAAALGAWASVRGFFTPATLFIVVNLVIGTIALTSRSHQQRRRRGNAYATTAYHDQDDDQHREQQQQSFHNGDNHHQEQQPPFHHAVQHEENQYYDHHHQQQQQYEPPSPAPAPLARTSSVLDRLRSIGLYRFRSGDFPPEYAAGTDDSMVATPAPAAGDAHHARSRSEPAREGRRRPAASRTARKPLLSSDAMFKAEIAPAPAARVVQAAVLEEDDGFLEEEKYARAEEFTTDNSFPQQKALPPAVQHEEEQYYREEYVPPLRPAPLARAPSVLERLRSFVLPGAAPLEEEYEFTGDNFAQQQTLPTAQHEVEDEQYYREEYVPPLRPAPLARAPSVLERLRSFGLSHFRSGDLDAAVAELERKQAQKQQQYSRTRSEPSREQGEKGKKQQQHTAEAKMSKSSSEVRKKPAQEETVAVAEEGGVDARADDFINSFRKQLQLQRLNSLLNYKDMLNRGA